METACVQIAYTIPDGVSFFIEVCMCLGFALVQIPPSYMHENTLVSQLL